MRRSWINGTIIDRLGARWLSRRLTRSSEPLDLFSCVQNARNILIVPNDRAGGLFFCVPACRRLRQQYPDARLSLLVKAPWASLARQIPYTDTVIEADLGRPVGSVAFVAVQQNLVSMEFDLAFCLGIDCSFRLAQLFRHASVRLPIGFSREGHIPHTIEISPNDSIRYEADRIVLLLDMLGMRGDSSVRWPVNAARVRQMSERYLDRGGPGRIVALDLSRGEGNGLAPGQIENILDRICRRGGRALVLHTQSECRLVAALLNQYGDRITPFEPEDPADAASLLPSCHTLIAGNTDLLHMGIALETPVIGLFDEDVRRWIRYGNERVKIIQASDLRDISVHQVDRELEEAFSGRSGNGRQR